MSFRLFIYYCALCGGASAFVGWMLGRMIAPGPTAEAQNLALVGAAIKGLFLGMAVALALSLVDTLWNMSVSQWGLVFQRVLAAVLVGCVGGFFGGLISQGLYNLAPLLGFVIGWTLTGALIGASPGTFDFLMSISYNQDRSGPTRKVVNGVLGGAVGGLIGGLLSFALGALLSRIFQDKPREAMWSPSSWGFVALGACIGLLIGLAQVILKDMWLKIEKGFKAGRELILSKPVITLGRAEGCDIGLFGDQTVDKHHARLIRKGNAYMVADDGSAGGTFVNGERITGPRLLKAGDEIRIGNCVLRFGERRKAAA